MADKLRVHILSKELGVTSKAILDKCRQEQVEGITNHMSTVSAGLAETIREWFSESHTHVTAVEDSAPVDLEKVRARRKPRRAKTEAQEAQGAAPPEAEAPAAAEPAGPAGPAEPAALPQAPEVVIQAAGPQPSPEPAPAAQAAGEEGSPAQVAARAPVAQPTAPVAAPESPPPPPRERIVPAGPQNVPAAAQLKGPQIVGYARPDPVHPPVPRAPRLPIGGPGVRDEEPGGRGRFGRPRTAAEEEAAKKSAKHRANPRRSGRSLQEIGERLREWNDRDLLERQERLEAASGQGIRTRRAVERTRGGSAPVIAPRKTKAQVTEPIVVHELCAATGIGLNQLWPKFKNDHGMMINRNSVVPADIAQMVMLDFGIELEVARPRTAMDLLIEEVRQRARNNLRPRPPVVTMLGHVDHGKTSLLDAIRRTSVAAGEAGGITQHIGAYMVDRGNLRVTFLDTPGHEAFTAMRARGANMTDVVVLVVAADDGVMPQTAEAINHAKAAKVAIVVALNKIDLPGVDLNKVYGQLSEHGLTPSEWGGDIDVIKTSATTGTGVEELVAHLSTLSELLDLKADPTVPAVGTVIEAQMKTGFGPLARVLIREGTLRTGDFVVCGAAAGRVRSLRDDRGRVVAEAAPGMPVELAGLDEVPNAGDGLYAVESLQRAKLIAEEQRHLRRQESLSRATKPRTLEDLFQQRAAGRLPELNMILRADVSGSIDAILKSLQDLPGDQVKLNILHTGIGSITESDVVLAEASSAIIVGFNVSAESGAQRRADLARVDIRSYRIIYEVIDDIRKALEGLLAPERREEVRGKAEVREIFQVSKVGTIAGCMVTEGTIQRSHRVRLIRDGQIIIPTQDDVKNERHRAIASLRRFKDDAREVRAGMECGIRVENFDDVKPGDVIEAYELVETARSL